jgi:hypothetical protein
LDGESVIGWHDGDSLSQKPFKILITEGDFNYLLGEGTSPSMRSVSRANNRPLSYNHEQMTVKSALALFI